MHENYTYYHSGGRIEWALSRLRSGEQRDQMARLTSLRVSPPPSSLLLCAVCVALLSGHLSPYGVDAGTPSLFKSESTIKQSNNGSHNSHRWIIYVSCISKFTFLFFFTACSHIHTSTAGSYVEDSYNPLWHPSLNNSEYVILFSEGCQRGLQESPTYDPAVKVCICEHAVKTIAHSVEARLFPSA